MAAKLDRGIIGREFDRTTFPPVAAEEIIEYAHSCGETNPLFTDERTAAKGPHGGLIAPPTFVVRLRGRRFMPKDLPRELARNSFDAGKDIEFGEPVRVGDVLTATSTVHDIYEKTGRSGTMSFLVLRTVVTNQRDELVATIDQRMMLR
jgi:acyl dehydratase